jgi:hypothetical protein
MNPNFPDGLSDKSKIRGSLLVRGLIRILSLRAGLAAPTAFIGHILGALSVGR